MRFHVINSIISFLFIAFAYSQQVQRIEISGKVHVPTEDREGITIYNQNSKQGTTTDQDGIFTITVAENDIIQFGSLQFKDFIIVIDNRIIESKQVSVQLVEDINKLDEVVVLPYALSGNLNVDANAVRTYNVEMSDIYKGKEDLEDYQFTVDKNSRIENDPVLDENKFINGVDFVGIFGMIFNNKKASKSKAKNFEDAISPISKLYNSEFFLTYFDIPLDLTEGFIEFVEKTSYNPDLLKRKNEVLLLQFLSQQSQLFLATTE